MDDIECPDILLVEDNPNDAELALRVIRKHGADAKVLVAKDGAEALDFIRGEGDFAGRNTGLLPGVIFLDLKLPRVDGLEVLREIKSDVKTAAVPVVVFTSSGEERDIAECRRLGANSYVVKPLEYEEYASTVGEMTNYWLKRNRRPE